MMAGGESRGALRTDLYLDALLAAGGRRPSVPQDTELDADAALAARRLHADLEPVHPSFRFEERLAGRLASLAARMRDGLAVDEADLLPFALGDGGAPGRVLHFPPLPPRPGLPALPQLSGLAALPPLAGRPSRPLIVGGVASAALSIGAVFVAWRWSRPAPMVRAARAAHVARRHSGVRGLLGVD